MTIQEFLEVLQSTLMERVAVTVLLLIVAWVWGSRCYWKGREHREPLEDGGWAEEAKWWRDNYRQFTAHKALLYETSHAVPDSEGDE